jgi:hypothetical protein
MARESAPDSSVDAKKCERGPTTRLEADSFTLLERPRDDPSGCETVVGTGKKELGVTRADREHQAIFEQTACESRDWQPFAPAIRQMSGHERSR